ncbi:hypothetical protein LLJ53_11110 [Pseudomonas aeruginosa]|uniref:hypothetical protein n=1 Tax=Pseudomonas aeruginosa TaxID=287 RepID=UPI0021E3CC52|nr:hypothetical protein [Pseudomonas aeruginosa]UYF86553.1 hypothetical protein LLJ53_11110 [Pseudomonas aeruginosa]
MKYKDYSFDIGELRLNPRSTSLKILEEIEKATWLDSRCHFYGALEFLVKKEHERISLYVSDDLEFVFFNDDMRGEDFKLHYWQAVLAVITNGIDDVLSSTFVDFFEYFEGFVVSYVEDSRIQLMTKRLESNGYKNVQIQVWFPEWKEEGESV